MPRIILFLFVLFSFASKGKEIRVRLFSASPVEKIWVTPVSGEFDLLALREDGSVIDTILSGKAKEERFGLQFIERRRGVKTYLNGKKLGSFKGVLLVPRDLQNAYLIKGSGKERIYSGKLEVTKQGDFLLPVSQVDLETYVAGVVESEGGHATWFAYLKAQAVLARTFALKNWNKHIDEGYNLKDDVTSQVYHSKAYLQNAALIIKAVLETKDSVLFTSNNELVFGAFHSNSGGQTANSEEAWSSPISYLRARPDSFSLNQPKSTWEKTIDKEDFVAYFARKFNVSKFDKDLRAALFNFKQETRASVFTFKGHQVPLKTVRKDFKLRSTFFSVEERGATVVLHGKGFGHGVGLSQEGAMEMAKRGYSFKEILFFYFQGTQLGKI